jgi:DNA modification methylase
MRKKKREKGSQTSRKPPGVAREADSHYDPHQGLSEVLARKRIAAPPIDIVQNVATARKIVLEWLGPLQLKEFLRLGLPEIDDRKNVWRVPIVLLSNGGETPRTLGEVVIDAATAKIIAHTDVNILRRRLAASASESNGNRTKQGRGRRSNGRQPPPPFLPNKVMLGDATEILPDLPANSVQLVFTSPPYYNAKPEYTEYLDYQEYLDSLRRVFVRCHEVLSEGRFFVINVSPILIRRASRQSASRRLAVPFDIHHVLMEIGFEFVDDIIWVKPEGAGWATGRGRRFAADRTPLQYKAVPVSEYVLVYRKATDRLIDWNIRTHHDPALVKRSKILGHYDVTNVWRISPGHHKHHPAVFPEELVEKVLRYYSFIDDLVLDPFAGSGTLGRVALRMMRRFFLIDNEPRYFAIMFKELPELAAKFGQEVLFEPETIDGLRLESRPQKMLFK